MGERLGGEQVDRYTAKMRKRLFAKMAADGAVLLKKGQAKATTGLGGAELDIMQYPGASCVFVCWQVAARSPAKDAPAHGCLASGAKDQQQMLAQQNACA